MKAVVTDYIESDLEWEQAQLAPHGITLTAHQLKFRPADEVYEAVKDADAIVVNMVKMDDALLRRLEKCKLLIRHGIGYDNVDVAACTRYGIQFAYQPDYCQIDVAEHAVALILSLARRIPFSRATLENSSRTGQWDFSELFPIYRMEGKTLGIVGLGRIGRRVARKLSGFGLKMLAADPYVDRAVAEDLGVRLVTLDELLGEADYITLHTSLTDETRRLINADALGRMKPTALLVNTSRGPIVDQEALADALAEGRIAGAAIDVFDVEPPPIDYRLFQSDRAILTPHIGWASEESAWEIRRRIVDDLISHAQGRPARCVINPEVLAAR
ncbi:MAG TPA: C-terminal binding protein [Candidatus Sumerlaeota bacterium]|nr:MAG: Glycerate dehydrogenase [candidate division BRC1 bacterium ADurb.BinA292]HOE95625.1 C-terminal binding protein [Candidatus Sumerlaeota bacterium]HOR26681.1 C-terminal binding protein [Candidatus Sumerlaeota bacterium]